MSMEASGIQAYTGVQPDSSKPLPHSIHYSPGAPLVR